MIFYTKNKNNLLAVKNFFNLQNPPTFHLEARLVYLVRRRECFVGLAILLVYAA